MAFVSILCAWQANNNGFHISVLTIFFITSTFLCSVKCASISTQRVRQYLTDFDYLHRISDVASISDDEDIHNALRKFQKFAGLTETGEEDSATLNKMDAPRCGDTDDVIMTSSHRSLRRKRWAVFMKWPQRDLTYTISTYTTKLPVDIVNDAVARAFKLWSDVAYISFTHVSHDEADIKISFQRGDHGDGRAFDGPGGVLGHTFPPSQTTTRPDLIGMIHLDEDENWTVNSPSGKNLWLTVAHEVGHAIGLSHSRVLPALMYPWYPTYDPDFQLHEDDIQGVQFLYGPLPGAEPMTPISDPLGPNNPNIPNLCTAYSDAITFTGGGDMFVFKDAFTFIGGGETFAFNGMYPSLYTGLMNRADAITGGDMFAFKDATMSRWDKGFGQSSFYWMLDEGQVVQGFPRLISDNWPGLQSNLSASFSMKNIRVWGDDVGKTYFFKTISGSVAVWKYNAANELEVGFPKALGTVFPDFQSGKPIVSVQGVAEISGNGETIFVMDNEIYIYGWEKVFRGSYQITDIFPNLWGKVISMIQGPDNYLYFFMEGGLYYQVSPWTFNISANFPKPIAQDWFSCNGS